MIQNNDETKDVTTRKTRRINFIWFTIHQNVRWLERYVGKACDG
jgi:DNA relaxase NicK